MNLVELIFLVLALIIIGLTSAAIQLRFETKYDSCSCSSGCATIALAGYILIVIYCLVLASSSYYGSLWTGLFFSLFLILLYPTYIGYLAHDLRIKRFTKAKRIITQIFFVLMTLLCIANTLNQALTLERVIETLNNGPELIQARVTSIRYRNHTRGGGGYFVIRTNAGNYDIRDSAWAETISPGQEITFVKDFYFNAIYSADNIEMTSLAKLAFLFYLIHINIVLGFAIYGYVMLFIQLKRLLTTTHEI